MNDLIIYGTGIHAREMADLVDAANAVTPTWNLLGFLDAVKTGKEAAAELDGRPVLGGKEDVGRFADVSFLPAYDTGPLDVEPERIASLVAPTAFVAKTATLGLGCVLYPGCFVGANARLGDRVFALANAVVNHDCVVGDRVCLATGAALAGSVQVGDDVYLGQSSTVRQKLRIGTGSLIGMGAVVVKDVEAGSVMVGNPAKRLRSRSSG